MLAGPQHEHPQQPIVFEHRSSWSAYEPLQLDEKHQPFRRIGTRLVSPSAWVPLQGAEAKSFLGKCLLHREDGGQNSSKGMTLSTQPMVGLFFLKVSRFFFRHPNLTALY